MNRERAGLGRGAAALFPGHGIRISAAPSSGILTANVSRAGLRCQPANSAAAAARDHAAAPRGADREQRDRHFTPRRLVHARAPHASLWWLPLAGAAALREAMVEEELSFRRRVLRLLVHRRRGRPPRLCAPHVAAAPQLGARLLRPLRAAGVAAVPVRRAAARAARAAHARHRRAARARGAEGHQYCRAAPAAARSVARGFPGEFASRRCRRRCRRAPCCCTRRPTRWRSTRPPARRGCARSSTAASASPSSSSMARGGRRSGCTASLAPRCSGCPPSAWRRRATTGSTTPSAASPARRSSARSSPSPPSSRRSRAILR